MKSYNIGDNVYFYISVACKDTVEGKIIEISKPDVYLIKYDNGMYEIHGQFITGLVISDKEIIENLNATVLNYDKKLQILNKRIVEADAEIERLKKKVSDQKNKISELEMENRWRSIFDYKPRKKGEHPPRITPRLYREPITCVIKSRHMEP